MRNFVLGFNDYVADNETGLIISLKRKEEHELAMPISNAGYYTVQLSRKSKYKHYLVHRLIWEAFNGPIPKGMVINHKDENKLNNRLDNLEICSMRDNIMYGTARKRMVEKRSVPVRQELNGEIINIFPSAAEASRQTGISQGNISRCCRGKSKTAGGFNWSICD